jgi:hypothetical protein
MLRRIMKIASLIPFYLLFPVDLLSEGSYLPRPLARCFSTFRVGLILSLDMRICVSKRMAAKRFFCSIKSQGQEGT